MTAVTDFNLSDLENNAITQLRSKLSGILDNELYEDTYQLYLFLKVQNFNVDEAEKILLKFQEKKKKMRQDAMNNIKPPEAIKKYFENSRIAIDKEGSTVHYIPRGKIDMKGICMSIKFPDMEKILTECTEEDLKILKKKRKTPDGPYPGVVVIYDLDGWTFANATDKKVIQTVIKLARFVINYYPSAMKAAYVINLPSYFMIPWVIVKNCIPSKFTNLVHFLGTDGWKEELLKIIDADQLPAFLGGNKTDPDGNPLCKTFVMQGGKIDESLYIHKSKSPLENAPGVKKLILERASFKETELEIKEDGSLIEWEFETKIRDIGFGLFYKEIINGEDKMTELVSLQRIETDEYCETGVYKCEKAGTYVVLFDNSYSWVRSKELYYRIKIVTPKELEEEMQN